MTGTRKPVVRSDIQAAKVLSEARSAVGAVGASPVDVQVCFLEGLLGHPKEAKKFLEKPQEYATAHGVLLDPDLIRDIVSVVAFGEPISQLAGRLSKGAMRDIAGFRDRPNAAVLQGATAVSATASAAVVAAAKRPDEVARLKGLGVQGVRLPGGRTLKLPEGVHANVLVTNNAVAVYATTTTALTAISRLRGAGR
jgi:hypothetical protein